MHQTPIQIAQCQIRRASFRLVNIPLLMCILALAMHASAAGNRAIKSRVAPVYPEAASRLKIAGVVMVEATVDPDGNVADVKTLSGNRMLATAAEDAVRKWRFVPAPAKPTEEAAITFGLAQR
ncbi:MAG: energy transducer TonB [Terracidiphilus sp.]|jgi:protein TonB